MRVLPDTSIWIDYLGSRSRERATGLDLLLQARQVVICGPVMAELLAGVAPDERPRLASLLGELPWTELTRQDWGRVGDLAALLRGRGATVPMIDLVIAVSAVGADAELWTADRHFERVAEVLPDLRLYGRS